MENFCNDSAIAQVRLSSLRDLINTLFPLNGFKKRLYANGDCLNLVLEPTCRCAHCPVCKKRSSLVLSRYERTLQHEPMMGRSIRLVIRVRKFFCKNARCNRKIFSEQFDAIVNRYARISNSVKSIYEKILLETSSIKGAYILGQLGYSVSSSTCLRILHRLEMPRTQDVKVVGIDDYAFRKGMTYGTIIVDHETKRPIDMIDSRKQDGVVEWLRKHPSITVVTRDRATGYSNAIKSALPEAIQIADKFHIVKNLGERICEEIRQRYTEIKEAFYRAEMGHSESEVTHATPLDATNKPIQSIKDERSVARWNSVQHCKREGLSRRATAKRLGFHLATICKYWDMPKSAISSITYENNYQAYVETIHECMAKNYCKKDIFRHIVATGFKGKLTAFYSWFNKTYPDYKRQINIAQQSDSQSNKTTDIRFSLMPIQRLAIHVANPLFGISTTTGEVSDSFTLADKIISSSDTLQDLRTLSTTFREILSGNDTAKLDEWLQAAIKSPYRKIAAFAKGLERDIEAVKNAITHQWTNGPIEGTVNKIKTIKRTLYGRAKIELLRRKVCLSTST